MSTPPEARRCRSYNARYGCSQRTPTGALLFPAPPVDPPECALVPKSALPSQSPHLRSRCSLLALVPPPLPPALALLLEHLHQQLVVVGGLGLALLQGVLLGRLTPALALQGQGGHQPAGRRGGGEDELSCSVRGSSVSGGKRRGGSVQQIPPRVSVQATGTMRTH